MAKRYKKNKEKKQQPQTNQKKKKKNLTHTHTHTHTQKQKQKQKRVHFLFGFDLIHKLFYKSQYKKWLSIFRLRFERWWSICSYKLWFTRMLRIEWKKAKTKRDLGQDLASSSVLCCWNLQVAKETKSLASTWRCHVSCAYPKLQIS